jgi:HK97 family phage major capsid protein
MTVKTNWQLDREQAELEAFVRHRGKQGAPEADFLIGVRSAGVMHSDSPMAVESLNTTTSSEGGFLIPQEWSDRILQRAVTQNEVLRRCDTLPPPSGNTVNIPYVHSDSRADGSRPARSYWVSEKGTITESDIPRLGVLTNQLKKVAVLIYINQEQLDDDPTGSAEAFERICAEEIGFALAREVITGNGTGRPLGLLNSPAKITVSGESNQTAGTVWGPNVVKMAARLWGASWRNSVWLYNQELLDQLSSLGVEARWGSASTSSGTVDTFWNWNGSPTSGGWPTLLGRPAIPCEFCSAPGTEGDIILADLSQYVFAMKRRGAYSPHLAFAEDLNCYRLVLRVDGSPTWRSPVTPYTGTDTLSPIVTLADRT